MLALFIIVRYVFLDRDGVLNRKMPEGVYVDDWAQFEWLPGAVEALARMKRAGLTVILVSNQRGIALGRMTAMQLETQSPSLCCKRSKCTSRLRKVRAAMNSRAAGVIILQSASTLSPFSLNRLPEVLRDPAPIMQPGIVLRYGFHCVSAYGCAQTLIRRNAGNGLSEGPGIVRRHVDRTFFMLQR